MRHTVDSGTARVGDTCAVEAMLGRAPRGEVTVVVRCHQGLPAVIEVPPVLPGGEPFPTLYWLTCPLAVKRVGRLEGAGLVRAFERRFDVSAADAEYAALRQRHFDAMCRDGAVAEGSPAPGGGVSGARGGVKCLHGRYAYWLAGGDDPAGAETARLVGVLDCNGPCVVDGVLRQGLDRAGRFDPSTSGPACEHARAETWTSGPGRAGRDVFDAGSRA